MRFLTRQGYLIAEQGTTYLGDTDAGAALAPLQQAACTYRLALGPRAGQSLPRNAWIRGVLTLQPLPSQAAQPSPQCCVNEQGFEGAC